MSDEVEEAPRALNLVVHMEKGEVVYFGDVAEAAAKAVVALLHDERATLEWRGPIALWRGGRIRKLCRRARGVAWEKTSGLAHVEVSVGTATVRAFVPVLVSEQDPLLSKLQLQGTEFAESREERLMVSDTPVVAANPLVPMSGPKAVVAIAHAVQLVVEAWERRDPDRVAAWMSDGMELSVRRDNDIVWAAMSAMAEQLADKFCAVVVRDAGFTEVAPGSVTAVGMLYDPEPGS